jgi:hypothetical protein
MACRYVLVTRWGTVYPCRGQTYKGGQHWHDYPQLSPPRDARQGDIDEKTGEPVQIGRDA